MGQDIDAKNHSKQNLSEAKPGISLKQVKGNSYQNAPLQTECQTVTIVT